MKYNRLCEDGLKVSHISLGGAAFSNIYGTYNEQRGIELIQECLNHGINYFETGHWYGQGSSEKTFGQAPIMYGMPKIHTENIRVRPVVSYIGAPAYNLAKYLNVVVGALKNVPRSSYYISSKVGRYEVTSDKMFDFSAEKTVAALETTLQRLGLDYVDIIQIHDPTFAPSTSTILKETLPTLAQAVRDGKARFIGLADYDVDLMKEIIEESDVKISTVLSYAKSTMIDNRLQNYTGYFRNKGIGVINAAATGMGLLTNSGPQPWHPACDNIKFLCKKASEYCKTQKVELARLATWFTLNQPGIATNICGFFNTDQLRDTLTAVDAGLSEHEARVLNDVQTKFFDKVTLHWDHVELPAYKAELEKKRNLLIYRIN